MPSPKGKCYEFHLNANGDFDVTPEVLKAYEEDGGFLVKGLFDKEELDNIAEVFKRNDHILKRAWDLDDGSGSASRLSLWGHPGSDVTGMVARCEKVAGTCEKLLKGEVYHYHTKLMMKEARTGGKHLWHQDYGYWYKNGNLRPDMNTCFIALDPCTVENGCLQIIKGTHHCGRIDHILQHGQTVADQERVDQLLKHYELVYVTMDPGDALFFDCNLLHTSDKNPSENKRWAFLCAYNRADNDPVYKHHHPNYTPLHKVPNDAVRTCRNYDDMSGKEFMDPTKDQTVKANLVNANYH